MLKKAMKWVSLILVMVFMLQATTLYTSAADRVYWYKKMTSGGSIYYWIDSDVEFTTKIRAAEVEIELPAAGFSNPMRLSQTTTQSSSKMDFHQYTSYGSGTTARTASYRSNSNTAMSEDDKDTYSSDQADSIIYGYVWRTATGVTADANAFFIYKYQ